MYFSTFSHETLQFAWIASLEFYINTITFIFHVFTRHYYISYECPSEKTKYKKFMGKKNLNAFDPISTFNLTTCWIHSTLRVVKRCLRCSNGDSSFTICPLTVTCYDWHPKTSFQHSLCWMDSKFCQIRHIVWVTEVFSARERNA